MNPGTLRLHRRFKTPCARSVTWGSVPIHEAVRVGQGEAMTFSQLPQASRRTPRIVALALLFTIAAAACGSQADISLAQDPVAPSVSEPAAAVDASDIERVSEEPSATGVPVDNESPQGLTVANAPNSGDLRDVDFSNLAALPSDREAGTTFGPLVDGEFTNGERGDEEFFLYFLDDPVFVDLDGDGIDEAVVSGAWSGGGSGYFSELLSLIHI